jgi:hypothetical protein
MRIGRKKKPTLPRKQVELTQSQKARHVGGPFLYRHEFAGNSIVHAPAMDVACDRLGLESVVSVVLLGRMRPIFARVIPYLLRFNPQRIQTCTHGSDQPK